MIRADHDCAADKVNRKANAWYELFVCPPTRVPGIYPMTVEVEGYDGSLTTSFDATGFGDIGNRCPNADAIKQEQATAFCESRQCGFFEGTFCGVCDVATVLDAPGDSYELHDEEAPVFLIPAGEGPDTVQLSTTDAQQSSRPDSSVFTDLPVWVTAHVGPDRALVLPGTAGTSGVTIDSRTMALVRTAGASSPEVLLHVVPATGARWLRMQGPSVPIKMSGASRTGLAGGLIAGMCVCMCVFFCGGLGAYLKKKADEKADEKADDEKEKAEEGVPRGI